MVLLLLLLLAASAYGEETNLTLIVNGVTYQNARWGTITPDSVSIIHRSGVTSIPLSQLSPELQKKFGYDPQKAQAYKTSVAARQASMVEQEAYRRETSGKVLLEGKIVDASGLPYAVCHGWVVKKGRFQHPDYPDGVVGTVLGRSRGTMLPLEYARKNDRQIRAELDKPQELDKPPHLAEADPKMTFIAEADPKTTFIMDWISTKNIGQGDLVTVCLTKKSLFLGMSSCAVTKPVTFADWKRLRSSQPDPAPSSSVREPTAPPLPGQELSGTRRGLRRELGGRPP